MNGSHHLIGVLGDLRGYDELLFWRLPVLSPTHGDSIVAPRSGYWTTEQVVPVDMTDTQVTYLRTELPNDLSVPPGSVAILAGPAYAARLRSLGLDLSSAASWFPSAEGFLLAVGSITLFDTIELEHASLLRGAFSKSFGIDDQRMISATRLLERNGKLDQLSRLVYRAMCQVGLRDVEGLKRLLIVASSSVGIDEEELLSALHEHGMRLDQLSPSNEYVGARDRVADVLRELQPRVFARDLPPTIALRVAAEEFDRELAKARAMRKALTLDCSGLKQSSRISTPSLALLSHMAGLGGRQQQLTIEFGGGDGDPSQERDDFVARSGLDTTMRLSGLRSREPDQRVIPLQFGWVDQARGQSFGSRPRRDTKKLLAAEDIHITVPANTPQSIFTNSVPHWLRRQCPSLSAEVQNEAVRCVASLVRNIHQHSELSRRAGDHSRLILSTTSGGGGDRLWVIVADNGCGVMSSLRRRSDRTEIDAEYAALALLGPINDRHSTEARRDLRFGFGLADAAQLSRSAARLASELEPLSSHSARLYLFTTAVSGEGIETVIASVSNDESRPKAEVITGVAGATGTTIVLELPLARVASSLAQAPEQPELPFEAASEVAKWTTSA